MRQITLAAGITLMFTLPAVLAQPPGITMEMINTTLPEDGAPLAVIGDYDVISEGASGSAGHLVYRPANLGSFPASDTLPVMVWGNGGCAIDSATFSGFLSTVASHGILVITTAPIDGEARRQQTTADLRAGIDWAEAENQRAGSPLQGKIDTAHVAVMGQSCGGMLSVGLGPDPRVDTIGVFNSGVQAPAENAQGPVRATTDDLMNTHGPVLLINGHERDFMMEASRANFDMISHVPAFYGARHDGGHLATMTHPGGGEFANVATNWLLYQFKGDELAGQMFAGEDCSLCTDSGWDTASKALK